MNPSVLTVYHWLQANEALALWLEGIALVLIFVLELAEYKRQGQERKDQHEESVKEMQIARDAATAAKASADALLNSERAWIEISLTPIKKSQWNLDDDDVVHDLFVCSIQIKNHGTTLARIVSVQQETDTVDGPLAEQHWSGTLNLNSLLGSGQTEIVGRFDADDLADGVSIVNGTKRGILRILVKYRDVVDASMLHESSVLYVFQGSLEDEPDKVWSQSVYT